LGPEINMKTNNFTVYYFVYILLGLGMSLIGTIFIIIAILDDLKIGQILIFNGSKWMAIILGIILSLLGVYLIYKAWRINKQILSKLPILND
jgi:hypothetical protein